MTPSPVFADLSSNNPIPDYDAYVAAEHVVVAIKATEGTSYVNPDHRAECLEFGRRHVTIVHYHFARPDLNDSAASEARHFLEVALPLTGGRDYLALDLERATPAGWQADPAWAAEFRRHVRLASRFDPILYASRSTLQLAGFPHAWEDGRVWDADWSSQSDFVFAGGSVAIRQTSDGVYGPEPHSVAGVGQCDVNVARGQFWEHVLQNRPRHH